MQAMVSKSFIEEVTRPPVLIAFSFLLGLLFYLYHRFVYSPYQAFARTGVKGPRPKILLGSILEYMRLGEMQMYHRMFQSYGPVFGFYLGTKPVLVIADPTLLDLVLTADSHTFATKHQHQFLMSTLSVHGLPLVKCRLEDEDGQKARKCLRSILFLPKLLKLMVPVILYGCDNVLLETLEKSINSPTVDIWSIYEPYCLQVILSVLGLSSGKHISTAVTSYFTAVNRSRSTKLIFKTLLGINNSSKSVPCLKEVMKGVNRQVLAEKEFNILVDTVSDTVSEAKQYHQHTGVKRNYLQVLLDQSLTEDQVVSYTLIILLVGYHTILSCLSTTTHKLAMNPLHQQKLFSEVNNSVQRETLYYETVERLEFLNAVVQESLRLHCLTPKLSRVCMKDYNMKTTKVTKGTNVEIPVNFIHHHNTYWDNPYSFCPDRFMTQPLIQSHKTKLKCPAISYAYLPFGGGSHSCLGIRFTVTCVKLTLSEVIQRFKFSLLPKDRQVADECIHPTGIYRPTGGLHIRVIRREKRKRLMSFATIVQCAMQQQTTPESDTIPSSNIEPFS